MKFQGTFISAVILAAGILVTPDNVHDGISGQNKNPFLGIVNEKSNVPGKVGRASWKTVGGSDTLHPTVFKKIRPESVPWIVKIQTTNGYHMFTGALITWQKYNLGIIFVDKPFIPDHSLNVVQFPALNKRKYLELTDQVIARQTNCTLFQWNNKGVLQSIQVSAVDPYRLSNCHKFLVFHEFFCSMSAAPINDDSDSAEGTPIMCGEDIYGIWPDAFGHTVRDTATNRTVYVWLRLDEFVHLIVDVDPELEDFVKYVQY